jgi:hypothetical protein
MERLIEVSHENGAWRLALQGVEPTLYLSGGRAERAARRLASSLAETGCDIRVHVHDKQNVLIGDHCFYGS